MANNGMGDDASLVSESEGSKAGGNQATAAKDTERQTPSRPLVYVASVLYRVECFGAAMLF